MVPYYDPFWRGNLEEVRRLLEALGLEVNSFFLAEDSIDTIRQAGSASLNIVISQAYGLGAARLFEELHATPYLSLPLPVGAGATEPFLRAVGAAARVSARRVSAVIDTEHRRYYRYLEPLTDCFNDLDLQRYAVVVGDANYAGSLTRFLADDLGWLPELTVCTDPFRTEEEGQHLHAQIAQLRSQYPVQLVFETDGSRVISHLREQWPVGSYRNVFAPAFVVGTSLERELAAELGAPQLSVSFPVSNRAVLDRGYTGYRGGLRLVEDLIGAIIPGR